jgi:hypothetical protein
MSEEIVAFIFKAILERNQHETGSKQSLLGLLFYLKMEVICSSETSVDFDPTDYTTLYPRRRNSSTPKMFHFMKYMK